MSGVTSETTVTIRDLLGGGAGPQGSRGRAQPGKGEWQCGRWGEGLRGARAVGAPAQAGGKGMAGGPWGVARAGGRHLSWAARTEWGASIGTGPPRGPRGRKNQNTLPCYLFSTRGHRGSDVCARYPSRMNTNSRLLSAEPPCGLGTPVGLPTRSQECPRVSVQLRRGPRAHAESDPTEGVGARG